jgi:hypothetical protein
VYLWVSLILRISSDYLSSSINQLIFVMQARGTFFEVRTEFLNVDQMRFRPICKADAVVYPPQLRKPSAKIVPRNTQMSSASAISTFLGSTLRHPSNESYFPTTGSSSP